MKVVLVVKARTTTPIKSNSTAAMGLRNIYERTNERTNEVYLPMNG